MSQISYKFKGDASHSSLKFEGSSISVGQIKQYIKQKHNLNQADRRAAQELQVFNAETGHEIKSDAEFLPRDSSVIVKLNAASTQVVPLFDNPAARSHSHQPGDVHVAQPRRGEAPFAPTGRRVAPHGYQSTAPTSTANFLNATSDKFQRDAETAQDTPAGAAAILTAADAASIETPVPANLACAITGKLMLSAVMLTCCRRHIDWEAAQPVIADNNLTCPLCHTEGISFERVVALDGLRKAAALWLHDEIRAKQASAVKAREEEAAALAAAAPAALKDDDGLGPQKVTTQPVGDTAPADDATSGLVMGLDDLYEEEEDDVVQGSPEHSEESQETVIDAVAAPAAAAPTAAPAGFTAATGYQPQQQQQRRDSQRQNGQQRRHDERRHDRDRGRGGGSQRDGRRGADGRGPPPSYGATTGGSGHRSSYGAPPSGGYGGPPASSGGSGGYGGPPASSGGSGGYGGPPASSGGSGGYGGPPASSGGSGGYGGPPASSGGSGGYGGPPASSGGSGGYGGPPASSGGSGGYGGPPQAPRREQPAGQKAHRDASAEKASRLSGRLMTREEYEASRNAAAAAPASDAAGTPGDAKQAVTADEASVVTSSRIVVKKHAVAVPGAPDTLPARPVDGDAASVASSGGRRRRRSRGGRRRRGRSRSPPPAQRGGGDAPVYGGGGGGGAPPVADGARRVVVVRRQDQAGDAPAPRYESGAQERRGGEGGRSRNRSRRRRRR